MNLLYYLNIFMSNQIAHLQIFMVFMKQFSGKIKNHI